MIRSHGLLAGGGLSAIAALLHLGCIPGGPAWYRFFGAGERMARLAEAGSWRPAVVTLSIAALLASWSACGYAFFHMQDTASAAGAPALTPRSA